MPTPFGQSVSELAAMRPVGRGRRKMSGVRNAMRRDVPAVTKIVTERDGLAQCVRRGTCRSHSST